MKVKKRKRYKDNRERDGRTKKLKNLLSQYIS